MCSCLSYAQTEDLAHSPGMCPDWELKRQSFGSQAGTQSTEPHQPGHIIWPGKVYEENLNSLGLCGCTQSGSKLWYFFSRNIHHKQKYVHVFILIHVKFSVCSRDSVRAEQTLGSYSSHILLKILIKFFTCQSGSDNNINR